MDIRDKARASSSILDTAILLPAIGQAFAKLDPRRTIRNPTMFVVEVVATLVTIVLVRDIYGHGDYLGFTGQIASWLWMTVLFANFAEAIAEGRGKGQAATLRKARTETQAKCLLQGADGRYDPRGLYQPIAAPDLKPGDIVLVEMGDLVPSDGEVVEGCKTACKPFQIPGVNSVQ